MRTQADAPGWRALLGSCMALMLGACGGGGGGGVRPSAAAPAPPPVTQPAQPPVDVQLTATHADSAHAQGYTGQGVTIGVIDSGVMRNHPMLAGRVLADLIYVDPTVNNTKVDDVVGHGTWVSETAAGRPFGVLPGGVAPDADIVSARLISDVAPKDDGSGQGNKANSADPLGQIHADLIAHGVSIVNNSWGGIYWDASNTAVTQSFHDAYYPFVHDHGGLEVFAAGNDARSTPSDIAQLPTRIPELAPGWLAVVAVDSNNTSQLASYSNACGSFTSCLAAPGSVIVSDKDATATSSTYLAVSGTSFAAPQVSGAAALVWQAYPYFTNDLVRQTLLGTAQDIGAPGVDPVFGYGLLDVGKAVNGPAKFDWGRVTVNFSGTSSWNNAISGSGGLTKQGPGTLILSQPSTFTDSVSVEGGVLSAKSLATSVSIGPQGTLARTPLVSGTVDNAGQLLVAGGDTVVAGAYSQSGRLSIELGYKLQAAAATLAGDLYVAGAASGYTANAHTTVLTTTNGLTGKFTALNTAPSVFLQATLNYDVYSAWLNVQQVQASAVPALTSTPASAQGAARVDGAFAALNSQLAQGTSATGTGVWRAAASLQQTASLAQAQASLQSLSGQMHAASLSMLLQSLDAGTRALSDRFDALSAGATASAWAQTLGYRGSLSQAGFRAVGMDMSGWMAGQDLRQGQAVFGFGAASTQAFGAQASSNDRQRSRTVEGSLYAGVLGDDSYAFGRTAMGSYRQSMQRVLQLGELSAPVGSDGHGWYGLAYVESGWKASAGGVDLTPFADMQYAYVRDHGFDESGGDGFGLKGAQQTSSRWQAGVGMRASRPWLLTHGGTLRLQGHVSWQRAFAVRGATPDASFQAFDQWAPIAGIGLARYGGVWGAALQWNAPGHGNVELAWDEFRGEHDHARMVSFNYEYRW